MANPFDIQPRAFQSPLRQPEPEPEPEPSSRWQIKSDDFVSVMLGSAAEVGIDVASFGIFQPDIVPDYMERNSPIAYFIGSTAGMIAGMYPSFGTANLAIKGTRAAVPRIFNLFKFSSRVLKVAEEMTPLARAVQPAHAFATGIGHTAAVFALNDSAREITRQVKENDPNLYAIGEKAVKGAIGGFYLGQVGKFTHDLRPAAQAVSMGAAMTMAEALTDAAEGVDVWDEDYVKNRLPKTFLQGAAIGLWNSRGAIGLWNSRGWKGRRNAMQEFATTEEMERLKKEGIIKKIPENLIDTEDNMNPEAIKDVMQLIKEEGIKTPDMFGEVPANVHNAAASYLSEWGMEGGGRRVSKGLVPAQEINKIEHRALQIQIKTIQGKLGIEDKPYRLILQEIIGKDSTKKMNIEEMNIVLDHFKDLQIVNLHPIKGKFREAGPLEIKFRPADDLMNATNLSYFTKTPETASILMSLKEQHAAGLISSLKSQVRRIITDEMPGKQPSKIEAFGKWAQKKPSAADEVFVDIMEGNIPQSELSPRLNRLAGIYKTVTDYYWHSTNQVRELNGEPPLTYKEYYVMHQLDRVEMIRRGYKRSEIPTVESMMTGKGRGLRVSGNIKSVTEIKRTQNEYPMRRDPWFALESMIHNDLKVIYFTEPVKIMNAQVKKAVEAGMLDKSALDANSTLNQYMEQVIMARPTPNTVKFNKMMERIAETKPGEFIDKIAVHFGRDLFTNTAEQINSLVGRMTTRAFIGFKPRMAGRNVLQFLFGYGNVDAKYIAKALLPIEHPKVITDMMKESLGRKQTLAYKGEEYIHTSKEFMGRFDAMANDMFAKSTEKSFDVTYIGTGYNVLDRIRNPKRNWGDAEGHKMRSEAKLRGDPNYNNYISARERGYLKAETEEVSIDSNFLYTHTGMPMIYRSAVAAPFVKLQSFTMNYFYKYLGNLATRMMTGKPGWAKDMPDGPTLTIYERAGLVRHFIGLGMLVAAVEKATGLDYSSLLGVSFKPDEEKLQDKINFGIFNVRPNPSMSLFLGMKKMLFADEEWQREEGKRELYNAFPVPYKQAYKDWEKALGQGKVAEMFVYKPYKRPIKAAPRKRSGAFGEPFSGTFGKPFGAGF